MVRQMFFVTPAPTMFVAALRSAASRTPVVAFAVRAMFGGIRRQRKAAEEAGHAQGNDTDAECQTNPLENIGHPDLAFHRVRRGREAIGSSGLRFTRPLV